MPAIKSDLQSLLNVKIDLVGDFDYGLKEVFEKRPSVVFIQDQISGVTGESVARHIQMLLGSGTPSFIFMHEGNHKAKPVKGLYEYLIDLSQAEAKTAADIQAALKSLLGPEWQKIYFPPKADSSVVKTALTLPDDQRISADKLVDEFITDLEEASPGPFTARIPLSDFGAPDIPDDEPFDFISSQQDQLSEIISEAARKQDTVPATATDASSSTPTEKEGSPAGSAAPSEMNIPSKTSSDSAKPVLPAAVIGPEAPVAKSIPSGGAASPVRKHPVPTVPDVPVKVQPPAISPADFKIVRQPPSVEAAPEDSQKVFEPNYHVKSATRKWYRFIVLLLVLCLLGGWFLLKYTPRLPVSKNGSTVAGGAAQLQQPVTPAAVVQKPFSTSHQSGSVDLPSFIPRAGYDSSFASQKPGWERYAGADSEYRVFRSGGKLKAIQVLAAKGQVISEARLKSMVLELTGTSEYRVTSVENKSGFEVSHATAGRKAELMMYRKQSAVHAFVVSID
ncbi:MAG: hypothetical protein IPQ16_08400 [Geobacteraceae bacterium]|nr:hypothetical protein [Geobacteraceae bacterium]